MEDNTKQPLEETRESLGELIRTCSRLIYSGHGANETDKERLEKAKSILSKHSNMDKSQIPTKSTEPSAEQTPNQRIKSNVSAFLSKHEVKPSTERESESVLSAEQFRNDHAKENGHDTFVQWVTDCGPSNRTLNVVMEGFASLCVENKTKRIKEDVMINLSEVLDHSHIFESEYQALRKKILQIFES